MQDILSLLSRSHKLTRFSEQASTLRDTSTAWYDVELDLVLRVRSTTDHITLSADRMARITRCYVAADPEWIPPIMKWSRSLSNQ